MALPPASIALLLSSSESFDESFNKSLEEQQAHQQESHRRQSRAYERIGKLCAYVINMIRRSRHGRDYRRIADR